MSDAFMASITSKTPLEMAVQWALEAEKCMDYAGEDFGQDVANATRMARMWTAIAQASGYRRIGDLLPTATKVDEYE